MSWVELCSLSPAPAKSSSIQDWLNTHNLLFVQCIGPAVSLHSVQEISRSEITNTVLLLLLLDATKFVLFDLETILTRNSPRYPLEMEYGKRWLRQSNNPRVAVLSAFEYWNYHAMVGCISVPMIRIGNWLQVQSQVRLFALS
jgi:hypothetical protein